MDSELLFQELLKININWKIYSSYRAPLICQMPQWTFWVMFILSLHKYILSVFYCESLEGCYRVETKSLPFERKAYINRHDGWGSEIKLKPGRLTGGNSITKGCSTRNPCWFRSPLTCSPPGFIPLWAGGDGDNQWPWTWVPELFHGWELPCQHTHLSSNVAWRTK